MQNCGSQSRNVSPEKPKQLLQNKRFLKSAKASKGINASYHVVAKPPKVDGVCDSCGGELIIRKDDAPETVLKRLEVYHASTEVLKDFYAKLGRLHTVNGNQSIEGANEEILKAIGAKV